MARFLLYLPGWTKAKPSPSLEDVGLADLDGGPQLRKSHGPDGQSGTLVGWLNPGALSDRLKFSPDAQIWLPAVPVHERPGDSTSALELAPARYWVGVWKDALPVPAELARDYPYPGQSMELGDGNAWLFPEANELPRKLMLADDGSPRFTMQRKFHALWIESQDWAKKLAGEEGTEVPYADCFRFLTRALQLNYRLVPEVASLLRLFSTTNFQSPLFAIVGPALKPARHDRGLP